MRLLKALVIVMGVLIVMGTVTLVVLIVQRSAGLGSSFTAAGLGQPAGTRIAGIAGTDLDKYVESDFKIRSGLCPNDHGLMTADDGGQRCPTCGFWTNKQSELEPQ